LCKAINADVKNLTSDQCNPASFHKNLKILYSLPGLIVWM
jgi:hypothetical protein